MDEVERARAVEHQQWKLGNGETRGALAAALAKAQGAMHSAIKDRENKITQNATSTYASLAACWDACRDALSANGLSVVQPVRAQGKTVTVTTLLLHSSGESLSCELTMEAAQSTPQSIGSCITYSRRYGLCAMVGIAPDDDDDGNEAQGKGDRRTGGRRERAPENDERPPPDERASRQPQGTATKPTYGADGFISMLDSAKSAAHVDAILKSAAEAFPEASTRPVSIRDAARKAKERIKAATKPVETKPATPETADEKAAKLEAQVTVVAMITSRTALDAAWEKMVILHGNDIPPSLRAAFDDADQRVAAAETNGSGAAA